MQLRPIVICLIAVLLGVSGGCAAPRVVYRSGSPDGSKEVRLVLTSHMPLTAGSFIRLELAENGATRAVKEWYANDLNFCFAAASWDYRSNRVIVLWRNCWAGSQLYCYDMQRNRNVAPTAMIDTLSAAIRSTYRLPQTVVDPVNWAQTNSEAGKAFMKTSVQDSPDK